MSFMGGLAVDSVGVSCTMATGLADIIKRRLLKRCSDLLKTRNFHCLSQSIRNDECPRGVNIRTLVERTFCSTRVEYVRVHVAELHVFFPKMQEVIYIGVGFALPFLDRRRCECLSKWERYQERTPTLFLYVYV